MAKLVMESVVHAIFNCSVCGKEWENYLTAKKNAIAHVDSTGHAVEGEEGIAIRYVHAPSADEAGA